MSMGLTPDRPTPAPDAYTRLRRVIHAFKHIRDMAAISAAKMEAAKAAHVAKTYGVEVELVKRIKARFRNELSFGAEGK